MARSRPARRLRRRDVGRFEPPPYVEPAPLETVLEEGLMIARAGVRMSVRNDLIVATLRDGLPFDAGRLADVGRHEYRALARENREAADRVERERAGSPGPPAPGVLLGDASNETDERRARRPQVQRALADALDRAAGDESGLRALVEEARIAAWEELAHEIAHRLAAPRPEDDPAYLRERPRRIRALIETDLGALGSGDRALP